MPKRKTREERGYRSSVATLGVLEWRVLGWMQQEGWAEHRHDLWVRGGRRGERS